MRVAQREILADYDADMVKYATKAESIKTRAVYESLTTQFAKENRKFQYRLIGSNVCAATYEICLWRLKDAGLIYQCFNQP